MATEITSDCDAWKQIVAGIDAMGWSELASWDAGTAKLIAAGDESAFDKHWVETHNRSGRWICWIAFGVGAESLTRGVFAIHGYEIPKGGFGTSQPWARLGMPQEHHAGVGAAIRKLAKDVRNRDAHRYWAGCRSNDFPLIASTFVPALNHIVECLDSDQLRARHASNSESSHM